MNRGTEFHAGHSIGLDDPAYRPEGKRAEADNDFRTIDPYSSGESCQNFIDPSLTDWQTARHGENYIRLSTVKRRYDRYRFFPFARGIA